MNTPGLMNSTSSSSDNLPTDRETRSKIYLDLMLLDGQLNQFIHTHEIADADDDRSRLITTLIRTRRSIEEFQTVLTQLPWKA